MTRFGRPLLICLVVVLLTMAGGASGEADRLAERESRRAQAAAEADRLKAAEAKAEAALRNARSVQAAAEASSSPDAARAREITAAAVQKAEAALALLRSQRQDAATALAEAEQAVACEEERRLAARLAKLEADLTVVRAQLLKLDREVQRNDAALSAWTSSADRAATEAKDASIDLLQESVINFLMGKLEPIKDKLNGQLAEAESEIARAEASGAPAAEILRAQRDKILVDLGNIKAVEQAKEAAERMDEAVSDSEARSLNEQIKRVLEKTLESDVVKNAVGPGRNFSGFARFADYVVNYSYHATDWVLAYQRAAQLNRNTDSFLDAMKSLARRNQEIVREIQQTEKEIETSRRRCHD